MGKEMEIGGPQAEGVLLAERAFQALRMRLVEGALRAGQFVSMSDLMKMIGMPIAPVREAVKRAQALALVRVLPKRGVAVMEALPERIRECFHLRTIFDQEGAREWSARKSSQAGAELQALRAAHQQVLDAARGGVTPSLQRAAMEVDWKLHAALAAALDNEAAAELYAHNRDCIAIMQHSRPLLPDRIVPAMEEHLAIIDALAAGDAELAVQRVREHYRQTLRWWGILDAH